MEKIKQKKSLGQHYLSSISTAKKIVSFLDIKETDTIVEIGAGRGALTQHISSYKFKKFIIIELDDNNCKYLKEKYSQAEIICKDAQLVNYRELVDNSAKLISNLPYNVGTRIFRKVIDSGSFKKLVLMFQREVANRIIAKVNTKEYGRLSLLGQKSYNSQLVLNVKPGSFTPPPEVQSSVIKLEAKTKCPVINDLNLFETVSSCVFNNRRKMLRASLKTLFSKETLERAFKLSNIKATQRPQTLSLDDFISLIKYF